MTHSPAPWTDDTGPLLASDGRPVGEPERGKPLDAEYPRVMADRRLIRAAPRLADALREILGGSRPHGVWRYESHDEQARDFDPERDADAEDGDPEEHTDAEGATHAIRFRAYEPGEQLDWLATVADKADRKSVV